MRPIQIEGEQIGLPDLRTALPKEVRPGQEVTLTTLGEAPQCDVDMMSVVIVGNSATRRVGSRLLRS